MFEVAGVQPTLLTGLETALAGIVVTIVARQARCYISPVQPLHPTGWQRLHLYQSAGWTTPTMVTGRALGHRLQTSMTAGRVG
ncbi:MAG: hypothetical protein EOO38_09675 [Cytophagaceae bacterium]|nr:MAG: hypothetical protein EOO38_09675 [Cytophagaceae bacterium]